MRKILAFIPILILSSTVLSAQLRFKGGIVFGTDISISQDIGAGVNFSVDYKFWKRVALVGSFTYVMPSTVQDVRYTSGEATLDVHYYFKNEGIFKMYGLFGYNHNYETLHFAENHKYNAKTGTGFESVNVGIGSEWKDRYFFECKYDDSYGQPALTVGLFF